MNNTKLRAFHIVFLFISIPYGFFSWLTGIVAGVYGSWPYIINLLAIGAYDLFAIIGLIMTAKLTTENSEKLNFWLLLPFVFFATSMISFIMLWKQH